MNPDIFKSDDVAKPCRFTCRTINHYGGTTSRPSFSGVSPDPDTIGYEWTGEFDLNALRVGGEIFESGKKNFEESHAQGA